MSDAFSVSIQAEDFDVNAELRKLGQHSLQTGAVVNFVGLVRDSNDGKTISAMELEHYPGMTESTIEEIIEQASQRWTLSGVRVIHRVGPLLPGDQIVLVAVASKHRGEAFSACEFVMDFLKTKAPFWKKERTSKGEHWVDARDSDDSAVSRWK